MLFKLRGKTKDEIDFWSGGDLESFSVNISPPDASAAIIKRLRTPKFWDSKNNFNEKMSGYYDEVSRLAIEAAYRGQGESKKKKKKH